MALPVLTVLYDKQEKQRLLFPLGTFVYTPRDKKPVVYELREKEVSLIPYGYDYTLEGFEHIVGVERKGSIDELRANLFSTDRRRASHSFRKLVASNKHPCLLLDMSDLQFHKQPYKGTETTGEIHDALFGTVAGLGIELLWLPVGATTNARRLQGERLVRFMLAHVYAEKAGTDIESLGEVINGIVTESSKR